MIIHKHKEQMNAFESKTLCNVILDVKQVSWHDSNVTCKTCLKMLTKGFEKNYEMSEIEKENNSEIKGLTDKFRQIIDAKDEFYKDIIIPKIVISRDEEWIAILDRIKRFAEIWELNPIPREKLYPLLVEFIESLKKEMEIK